MFERYTEKARRVIFFARYEASQYGSRFIDSEHILLALFREDPFLMNQALSRRNAAGEVRKEIERGIEPRERISTSVEVPLSEDSKRILRFAADEAERIGHRYVGTEHIALGILMTPNSVAGRILIEWGASLAGFRSQVASGGAGGREAARLQQSDEANATINALLAGIGTSKWAELSPYFSAYSQFVDSSGKCWNGREEIGQHFEALFVPYAKKGVTFVLESINSGGPNLFWANILWENVRAAGEASKSTHLMTILVGENRGNWQVLLIQVTPVRM